MSPLFIIVTEDDPIRVESAINLYLFGD